MRAEMPAGMWAGAVPPLGKLFQAGPLLLGASRTAPCLPVSLHPSLHPALPAGGCWGWGAAPDGAPAGHGMWGGRTGTHHASNPRRSKAECGAQAAQAGSFRRDEAAPGIRSPELRVAVIACNCRAVISGRRFTLEGECGGSQEQLGMGPRIFLWLFLEYRHMAGGGLWRYP